MHVGASNVEHHQLKEFPESRNSRTRAQVLQDPIWELGPRANAFPRKIQESAPELPDLAREFPDTAQELSGPLPELRHPASGSPTRPKGAPKTRKPSTPQEWTRGDQQLLD